MQWTALESNWEAAANLIRAEWPKLTPEDLHQVAGQKPALLVKLKMRYGLHIDDAERKVDEWVKKTSAPTGHEAKVPVGPTQAPIRNATVPKPTSSPG